MEPVIVAGIIGLLVFWKGSPLAKYFSGYHMPQLPGSQGAGIPGGINNTAPGTPPGATANKAPGTGMDIGAGGTYLNPMNPQSPFNPSFLGGLFGGLGNAVRGITGSGDQGGPYGSNTPGPQTYPDGTVGGPQVNQDNMYNDPNFPGGDPYSNYYQPGIGGNGSYGVNDGTVGGGDPGYWNSQDPWQDNSQPQPLDPYNTSNSDVGGGDGFYGYDGTVTGY